MSCGFSKGRVGCAYLIIITSKNLCLCDVLGVQLCYGESFCILAAQRTDRWIKRKVRWQVIDMGAGTLCLGSAKELCLKTVDLAQQAFPFH